MTVGQINPYRYKDYYYDTETGFYYLQSRYYDPNVGRIISPDETDYLGASGSTQSWNLFAYCENDSVHEKDPLGTVSYSGIVGFGIQIIISASVLCYQGFIGIEAIWFAFSGNNNFGNGLIPWCYWFGGLSGGININFDTLLSKDLLSNPKTILKKLGLGFSFSMSISFFLVTANKMSSPRDYLGVFSFTTVTAWGVTVSKANGSCISTYGVGFSWEVFAGKKGISIGKKIFGFTSGASNYWAIIIGSNAKSLYSIVKDKV